MKQDWSQCCNSLGNRTPVWGLVYFIEFLAHSLVSGFPIIVQLIWDPRTLSIGKVLCAKIILYSLEFRPPLYMTMGFCLRVSKVMSPLENIFMSLSEFRYCFPSFPCRCHTFDIVRVRCRYFIFYMSPFQGIMQCRLSEFTLTGPL